ncbi:hypothetical protein K438DRAFT_271397 [Mycena galopus ATCC 62051]|nr:hypothetical protein K438DRAFT_271397 [Mycena galopus ATCC 62051]
MKGSPLLARTAPLSHSSSPNALRTTMATRCTTMPHRPLPCSHSLRAIQRTCNAACEKNGKQPLGLGPGGQGEGQEEERRGQYIAGATADEKVLAGVVVGMSATEMFIKQVRGKLSYGTSNPSCAAGCGVGGRYGTPSHMCSNWHAVFHLQQQLQSSQLQVQRQRNDEDIVREVYAANQKQEQTPLRAATAQAGRHRLDSHTRDSLRALLGASSRRKPAHCSCVGGFSASNAWST